MGWPQIIAIILMSMDVGLYAAYHGKPKTGRYSLFTMLLSVTIWVAVLHAGGFWGGQ